MHEPDSNEKTKQVESYYDEYVSRQKKFGVNERHHSIATKLVSAGLLDHHHVLEIGCGIGTLTSLLVEQVKNGKLTSLDLSAKSIEEAKTNLSGYKNLELKHADILNYEVKDSKFDVIVLPDVLEHIPLNLHSNLFQKLASILNSDGFVFIHIPNPYYTEWCEKNAPHLLQIIDFSVTTNHLVNSVYPHGLYIHELKTYSVWLVEQDYQYIILKRIKQRDFSKIMPVKISFMDKIKYKLNGIFK
jgi:cyclopropane fatty-acyl-phospholipid synthase-like methyltransferase